MSGAPSFGYTTEALVGRTLDEVNADVKRLTNDLLVAIRDVKHPADAIAAIYWMVCSVCRSWGISPDTFIRGLSQCFAQIPVDCEREAVKLPS